MKDLGKLKYFLGIEFARSKQGVMMHQKKYSLKLVSKTSLSTAKLDPTPCDTTKKLTPNDYDQHILGSTRPNDEKLADQGMYQRIIGKLLYLTVIRLDITYSI